MSTIGTVIVIIFVAVVSGMVGAVIGIYCIAKSFWRSM